MNDSARSFDLMAKLAHCAADTEKAMQHYITPFIERRQGLLAQLGEALSGFRVGDTIYSPSEHRTLRITGITAMQAGGSYYWVARGDAPTGPAQNATGIFPNKWQLANPRSTDILAEVP